MQEGGRRKRSRETSCQGEENKNENNLYQPLPLLLLTFLKLSFWRDSGVEQGQWSGDRNFGGSGWRMDELAFGMKKHLPPATHRRAADVAGGCVPPLPHHHHHHLFVWCGLCVHPHSSFSQAPSIVCIQCPFSSLSVHSILICRHSCHVGQAWRRQATVALSSLHLISSCHLSVPFFISMPEPLCLFSVAWLVFLSFYVGHHFILLILPLFSLPTLWNFFLHLHYFGFWVVEGEGGGGEEEEGAWTDRGLNLPFALRCCLICLFVYSVDSYCSFLTLLCDYLSCWSGFFHSLITIPHLIVIIFPRSLIGLFVPRYYWLITYHSPHYLPSFCWFVMILPLFCLPCLTFAHAAFSRTGLVTSSGLNQYILVSGSDRWVAGRWAWGRGSALPRYACPFPLWSRWRPLTASDLMSGWRWPFDLPWR